MKKTIKNKIVLVEDSITICRDLKANLSEFGYDVIAVFHDGESFLQTESSLHYDLLIMDIYLAGKLNGVETVENLFQNKIVPVLFLTGTTEEKIIERAKLLNPMGYLLKPYTPAQLKITFEMAIQKWKIDDELRIYKEHLEETIVERTKELFLAKEKAEKSEQLKTAFIHNMSHEIRTPLNAIIGFTELLINPKINEEKKIEFVNYIQNSTASLLTLVDNVWQLSHIQIGEFIPVITKCYINQILDEIEIEIKKQAYQENKNLSINILKFNSKPDFHFFSDPTIIKKIIANIANNAVKYTYKGSVIIEYKVLDNKAIVSVKDTGIGIEKNNITNIFELFYKIDTEKNKLYRGAGLGLALAKSLADAISARIIVDSEFGIGSTFSIEIPSVKPTDNLHHLNSLALVNNSDSQKEFLENFLADYHTKFKFFSNANEFCSIIENGISFTHCILNVLNKEDGKNALSHIKKLTHIPIILLLPYEFFDFFSSQKNEDVENTYFLIKPIEKIQMTKLLKQLQII